MKVFRFSLFLIYLFLMLSNAISYAQDEDLSRYYPLKDGYKWEYEIICEDILITEEVEIAEKVNVGNIETIRMAYRNGDQGDRYVIIDVEGVKIYKEVDADGSYVIYEHPSIILPFNIEKVKSFRNEAPHTGYDDKGKLRYEGTSSEEIWFKGREDIIVPAGSFKDCLKLFTVSKWRDKDGSFGENKIETWLAKDIGLVKKITIAIEYIIDDGDVDMDIDIEEWRLKKAVLGDKSYGKPR